MDARIASLLHAVRAGVVQVGAVLAHRVRVPVDLVRVRARVS